MVSMHENPYWNDDDEDDKNRLTDTDKFDIGYIIFGIIFLAFLLLLNLIFNH